MDVDETVKQAPVTSPPLEQPTTSGAPKTPAGPKNQPETTETPRKRKKESTEVHESKKSKFGLSGYDGSSDEDDENDPSGENANISDSSFETVVHDEKIDREAHATPSGTTGGTGAALKDANVSATPAKLR